MQSDAASMLRVLMYTAGIAIACVIALSVLVFVMKQRHR
jgi:hypothetical protein